MNARDWVLSQLTPHTHTPQETQVTCYAPSNIALIKYWGKRNPQLNLPCHSSLSISLNNKGAHCTITCGGDHDLLLINENIIDTQSAHGRRLFDFIDLLHPHPTEPRLKMNVQFNLNIPVAAGLASSACIFAALTKSLRDLYHWPLSDIQCSQLARLGSGSASRSLFNGFVQWHCGQNQHGTDCYAEALPYQWPELRLGIVMVCNQKKSISSRDAMQQTTQTSPDFSNYSKQSECHDLPAIKQAIIEKDFKTFGHIAEQNAIAMHHTMQTATPSICYSLEKSKKIQQHIEHCRDQGLDIYYTQDAGPNIKLLFLDHNTSDVLSQFPSCDIIEPFGK